MAVTDLQRLTSGRRPPARHRSARAERPARLVDRLVAGDEAGAWKVVEGALSSGSDPANIYSDLLVPALRLIGDGWEAGDLSVADEHRASAVAAPASSVDSALDSLAGGEHGARWYSGPLPESSTACPGPSWPTSCRVAGFEPLDLGANTPAVSFAETALDADRLVAVLIGATTLWRDAAVRKVVLTLRRAGHGTPTRRGPGRR